MTGIRAIPGDAVTRTVLQEDQAMSAYRDRYDKFAANYLAFVTLANPNLAAC